MGSLSTDNPQYGQPSVRAAAVRAAAVRAAAVRAAAVRAAAIWAAAATTVWSAPGSSAAPAAPDSAAPQQYQQPQYSQPQATAPGSSAAAERYNGQMRKPVSVDFHHIKRTRGRLCAYLMGLISAFMGMHIAIIEAITVFFRLMVLFIYKLR